MMGNVICWFRQDLRLADNPALEAAVESGHRVLPLFIFDDTLDEQIHPGAASQWWLHHSLEALSADLANRGNKLVLKRGSPLALLLELAAEHAVEAIYWNRRYEPQLTERDQRIKSALGEQGIECHSSKAHLLFEPWEIRNQKGKPYRVFSQYWRKGCLNSGIDIPQPREAPATIPAVSGAAGDRLEDWSLLPDNPNWATGFTPLWQPGEQGARARLEQFIDDGLRDYKELRNRPDLEHVSRLSPHFHWGEIAPWRAWHAVAAAGASRPGIAEKDVAHFHSEMGWREFSYHLLYHFPTLVTRNWKPMFDRFPWSDNAAQLRAWQQGQTGYPLVDAGMRELWATGWMHNRVRMVVASFLIKHLMIHWREGERWFWDTLVDADQANNSASWQWVAGSGADAAPYFRIFNPIMQGEKFDPEGEYIRRWVPELAQLDNKSLFRPWEADAGKLSAAGVKLGENYPEPIVDHFEARERALAAYKAAKAETEHAN
ncbi:MAG: DNA photolyase family protein [Gammaproteobacteria bacterium]|nr:DNA photolyase family protein [Gammaproteobacteria bacterium]NND61008.1 deoxyribodipyrimidine photo-lyase [Gammaproteobacteria bacterium]